MKTIIAAVIAATALASVASVAEARPWHHHHKVCRMHHHHRVCSWR